VYLIQLLFIVTVFWSEVQIHLMSPRADFYSEIRMARRHSS